MPGWFVKLVALALIWAYLHHFIAGLRHLWMDATHAVTKEFGHSSALFTLALSVLLTLVLGSKLFVLRHHAHGNRHFGSKRIVVGAHYGLRDWLASASPPR